MFLHNWLLVARLLVLKFLQNHTLGQALPIALDRRTLATALLCRIMYLESSSTAEIPTASATQTVTRAMTKCVLAKQSSNLHKSGAPSVLRRCGLSHVHLRGHAFGSMMLYGSARIPGQSKACGWAGTAAIVHNPAESTSWVSKDTCVILVKMCVLRYRSWCKVTRFSGPVTFDEFKERRYRHHYLHSSFESKTVPTRNITAWGSRMISATRLWIDYDWLWLIGCNR